MLFPTLVLTVSGSIGNAAWNTFCDSWPGLEEDNKNNIVRQKKTLIGETVWKLIRVRIKLAIYVGQHFLLNRQITLKYTQLVQVTDS